jgi:hypothetical protein
VGLRSAGPTLRFARSAIEPNLKERQEKRLPPALRRSRIASGAGLGCENRPAAKNPAESPDFRQQPRRQSADILLLDEFEGTKPPVVFPTEVPTH